MSTNVGQGTVTGPDAELLADAGHPSGARTCQGRELESWRLQRQGPSAGFHRPPRGAQQDFRSFILKSEANVMHHIVFRS